MSKIYGLLCDGCGKSDIVSAEGFDYEDRVPRNNWVSVNVYENEGEPKGTELHVCSGACLEILSRKLRGIQDDMDDQVHGHTHQH